MIWQVLTFVGWWVLVSAIVLGIWCAWAWWVWRHCEDDRDLWD